MNNFFTSDEMKCKCCGKLVIDGDFKAKLNLARYLSGFQFIVTSGYRCEKHNRKVGSTSLNHVNGRAADIQCADSRERYEMVQAMIGAGMMGLGIGKKFVHCDTNRDRQSIWTY